MQSGCTRCSIRGDALNFALLSFPLGIEEEGIVGECFDPLCLSRSLETDIRQSIQDSAPSSDCAAEQSWRKDCLIVAFSGLSVSRGRKI